MIKDKIVDLYKTNFSEDKEKEAILNYWSMYFRIFAEKDNELKSFYAQVYANAPDKRFVVDIW